MASQAAARLKHPNPVPVRATKFPVGLDPSVVTARRSRDAVSRHVCLRGDLFGCTETLTRPVCRPRAIARRLEVSSQFLLEDINHISEWMPAIQKYRNPLSTNDAYSLTANTWQAGELTPESLEALGSATPVAAKSLMRSPTMLRTLVSSASLSNTSASRPPMSFVGDDDIVLQQVSQSLTKMDRLGPLPCYRRSGPREMICFNPAEVKAAIVTCGGLCPGLNTVVREIVWGLWFQYGVRHIQGIDGGYRGFYARNWLELTPRSVTDIHKKGGTFLGTSRGGHETTKIVNAIEDRGVNQVYIIGGDGTQRGALKIHEECRRRGLGVVVAGIPKTIDNDIPIIDKSFGFDTAVEEAQRAINAAHVEAESTHNCVGIVKVMGRDCGQIAMHATLASRDVDCCLLPEAPFHLEGEDGLYRFIENRLLENDHCVIVAAEGAGQDLIKAEMERSVTQKADASGNRALLDIGLWLSDKIKDHFASVKKEMTLKYIDPTYMIRAIPANASDNIYCTLLAHGAIHGAMAGYTGFTTGPVNGRHCYIPTAKITQTSNKVVLTDRMWARLLASTSQPTFMRFKNPGKEAPTAGLHPGHTHAGEELEPSEFTAPAAPYLPKHSEYAAVAKDIPAVVAMASTTLFADGEPIDGTNGKA